MLFLPLSLSSCYDDTGLKERVEDVENRVTTIEQRIIAINNDLAAVQQLLAALSDGAVITGVEETSSGYRLTLSDGRVLTLNHGTDGKDGNDGQNGTDGADGKDAPAIGVAEENGQYFWTITIDGKTGWLTDADGNPLPVTGPKGDPGHDGVAGSNGQDGRDGVTPIIGIKDGYWTVDYGNGAQFVLDGSGNKVRAVPEGGTTGIFQSIEPGDDEIVFVLLSGERFAVPRVDNFGITIDTSNPYFLPGQTRKYEMTLTNVSDCYVNQASEGWKAAVSGNVLTVTAPADAVSGDKGDIRLIVVNKRHEVRGFRLSVEVNNLRTLTFEDNDYAGTGNMLGNRDWSSLIDSKQYGGSLLYPNSAERVYNWYDEGNTELASAFVNQWGDGNFWGGGMVISNYVEHQLANGTYNYQLSVFYRDANGNGGHNGSANFCIQNGYRDTNPSGMAYDNQLPRLYFRDGKARVIKSMWVTATTYFLNVWINGNGLSQPGGDATFSIVVYAFDENGQEIAAHPKFDLASGDKFATAWQEFDLSSLGKVSAVTFNLECSIDNGYGMSLPAYFAFDDVTVVFE